MVTVVAVAQRRRARRVRRGKRGRLGDETLYTHHWRIARYPQTAFAEINAAHQAKTIKKPKCNKKSGGSVTDSR